MRASLRPHAAGGSRGNQHAGRRGAYGALRSPVAQLPSPAMLRVPRTMRPALATPLLFALAAAGSALAASPPARRPAPPLPSPPASEARTGAGIAVLRTPGPDAVLIRGGVFIMGSNE